MRDVRTEPQLFEQALGYRFIQKDLLVQACIHRSFINENPKVTLGHNERLEYLGDAVLELVTTDFLYKKYTEANEGELTAYRAGLVNAQILSSIALELGFNEYMLLSKGESKDTGKARGIILADAIEAVIGAIYLDGGIQAAGEFIHSHILTHAEKIIEKGKFRDAKSMVQEIAQEKIGCTPAYKVLKESGPDHDKRFVIGVYFGDTLAAEGAGKSKQEGEQQAAQKALEKNGWV